MVARPPATWVRAATVAILLSWLPCVPVGLCVAASSEAGVHSCCPRPAGVTMAAAPRECWLQSPVPLPVVPPPSHEARSAVDVHSHVSSPAAPSCVPTPARFSALAVVLRI